MLALTTLNACGSVDAPPSSSAVALANEEAVCVAAGNLTKNKEPEEALKLIAELRKELPAQPPAPPEATASATATVASTSVPTVVATATPTPTPTLAVTPTATAVVADEPCHQQVLDALEMIGNTKSQDAQRSRAQELQDGGPKWLPNWLAPLGKYLVPFMAVIVILLVLTRIFTQVRWMSQLRLGWWHNKARGAVCAMGIVFLLGGAYVLVAKYSDVDDTYTEGPDVWAYFWHFFFALAGAAFVAVVGAGILAAILASRMRVSILVRDHEGTPNDLSTGRVVAYLTELAGTPPQGLQIPSASDVTALSDGVLVELSGNKVLATIQKLMQVVLAVVPWTVVVDESSDGSLTVAMKLNGWGVASVAVTRKALHLEGTSQDMSTTSEPDLLKMAAAIVVANLASYHRGFEGLCGASEWRSIGLQYIATTDFGHDPENAQPILAYAVEWDPQNLLAELALQYNRYRTSDNKAELLAYVEWIQTGISKCMEQVNVKNNDHGDDQSHKAIAHPKRGHRDLYRRLLLNHVVAALNLRDIKVLPNDDVIVRETAARNNARLLMQDLHDERPEPGNFREIMRPVAAIAYRDLTHDATTYRSWFKIADTSLAPWSSYNLACHLALRGPILYADRIERLLVGAFMRPELMVWAKKDPSFLVLHEFDWFQKITGATPREIWDIEPFKSHKGKLEAIGLKNPSQLVSIGSWRLQEYLQVDLLQAERMIRLARLAKQVKIAAPASQVTALDDFYVEFTVSLIELGIEDKEDIVNKVPGPSVIAKAIEGQCLVKIQHADIRTWLYALTD